VAGGAAAVHALRDRVFTEPLARRLTWPFVPHVTLVDDAEPARIAATLTALDHYRVEVRFDRVHLLRESPGRVWEPIADAAFAAPAVVGRGGLPVELTVTERLDPEAAAFREGACRAERAGEEADQPFAVTARRDGEVVATATGHTRGDTAHLVGLVVPADQRGQGIGSHVLARVEALARERGCRTITAAVPSPRADAFLKGRGWTAAQGVEFRRDL
jgi:N-acetylglutamate synthase-like GNAT family acetyltransferase